MTQQAAGAEFNYELAMCATGHRPGHHRSHGSGPGFEFRTLAPLATDPDPRRLDLHASLRQPHGEFMVRVFRPRSAVTVAVLADLSASIGFDGRRRKLDVLADFCAAAARSAHRVGDAFAFIGANASPLDDLRVLPTRARGWADVIAQRLRQHVPAGDSAAGLLGAASQLGRQRSLVFLASDFHLPMTLLERVLDALARHLVVPVVLWDPAETELPWGIHVVRDLETGRRRRLLMRPRLLARIREARRDRQVALDAAFRRHDLRPLHLPAFDADRVTDYFLQRHGIG